MNLGQRVHCWGETMDDWGAGACWWDGPGSCGGGSIAGSIGGVVIWGRGTCTSWLVFSGLACKICNTMSSLLSTRISCSPRLHLVGDGERHTCSLNSSLFRLGVSNTFMLLVFTSALTSNSADAMPTSTTVASLLPAVVGEKYYMYVNWLLCIFTAYSPHALAVHHDCIWWGMVKDIV